MSNQQIKLFPPHDRLEFTATAKLICKSENVTSNNSKPQKRYGHLSFIYKSKLYVIGGSPVDNKNQPITTPDSKIYVYSYNLEKERSLSIEDKKMKKPPENFDVKWELTHAKLSPQAEAQFSAFSHAAYCIFPHKKRLYIFGGSTPDGKTSGSLFRLDLDSLQWSKPEQKGTTPKAREEAALSLYANNEKYYLVLYGGANYETYELFSDINLYFIESKCWFQCHNLSPNFIQPRLSPSICFNDNKIYVFGGYYLDAQYNKGYFNDMYQIEFTLTLQKNKHYARSFVKRLDEIVSYPDHNLQVKPEKRCASSLMFYKADFPISNQLRKHYKLGSEWLLIIGGQKTCDEKKKQTTTLNDIWIFSLNDHRWISVNLVSEFKSRCSFTSTFDKENGKVYIFGGLSSSDTILNDFLSIKLSLKFNQTEQEELLTSKDDTEETHSYTGQAIQDYFIHQICNSITFPFSAISLIIDNFTNFQSTFCDITYHISKSKNLQHNYIKFESNADFLLSNEAMLSHFLCLKGGIRTYVQGTDKKIKAEMNKENMRKQIGSNFMIGGLRIGSQLVFVNLNQSTYEIQIIVVLECSLNPDQDSRKDGKQSQTFRLFDFLIVREQIMSDDVLASQKNSQQARKIKHFFEKMCPQESRQRLRTIILQGINSIKKGEVKNVFYISKLKTTEGEQCTSSATQQQLQLYPNMLVNDIIYGDRAIITEIERETKIPIYECMDVSLRTYISHLFTQICQIEITLSVKGLERKIIQPQQSLLKIDQLLKDKHIVEVSKSFDLDCKIIELYTFAQQEKQQRNGNGKNLSEKTQIPTINKFFAHGTLCYHKGRLIKREPIPLGDYLLEYKLAKIRQGHSLEKPIILGKSSHYSAAEIFGHIELPEAVPVNLAKTDFVFPVMLEKVNQKLKLMEEKVIREKRDFKKNQQRWKNGASKTNGNKEL